MTIDTSNTTSNFDETYQTFEDVDFDDLMRAFQDWENLLRAENAKDVFSFR